MKKRLVTAVLMLALALSLVACGEKDQPQEEPQTQETPGTQENTDAEDNTDAQVKDTFTYSVFSDLGTTLNFFTADSREAMTFVKLIDTPLFSMLPDGSLHFYMAESFETEKGKSYSVIFQ